VVTLGYTMEPTLHEAFDVGRDLAEFYPLHAFDARDLCRFFLVDGQPEWLRELGPVYEQQLSGPLASLDEGLMLIHRLIRDRFTGSEARQLVREAALEAAAVCARMDADAERRLRKSR
jgi:hypothetical protein